MVSTAPAWAQISSTAVGHQFRQDDWPAIAAAPDGSLWIAWLSFVGDRDDVAIRHYKDGKWGNLQWVPGTSGDSYLPQVAVDASNRMWAVWSQQANNNWDIYARQQLDAAILGQLSPRKALQSMADRWEQLKKQYGG